MTDGSKAVIAYIRENFDLEYFRMTKFPMLPSGIRLQDNVSDECVVYYDLFEETVKVLFPDTKSGFEKPSSIQQTSNQTARIELSSAE